MATPALAINIANHKGTLLVSPVWGIVVFSALELAVSLVLGLSVSLVIGFSVSSVFGLFSLGVMVGAGLRFQVASYVAFRLLYLLLFYCYPAFYLVLNHTTFNQIKKRHSINYSDGFYIGLLYAVPLVLS